MGALKLLHQKLWEIFRKLYVIEFPFNKIVRLNFIAYYRIKKSTTGVAGFLKVF